MTRKTAKKLIDAELSFATDNMHEIIQWNIDKIYDDFEESDRNISVTLPEPATKIISSPRGTISPDLINLKRNTKYDIYIVESKDQT